MWIIPALFALVFLASGFFLLISAVKVLAFIEGKISRANLVQSGALGNIKPIFLRALGAWFMLVGVMAAAMTYYTFR
ncbi:hypothetical protein SUDANB171_03487 [Streptomyces sp. enrichment culture]|uniref:hypothetical protein n=1 Tax=Streptomyces sp. enrichment culture TaxID=1795815 RepID=UPI003F55A184